jgi:hypothetical protein
MGLIIEKQKTTSSKNKLKGKPLNEVVNNGWNRLSELYGVDMRQIAASLITNGN